MVNPGKEILRQGLLCQKMKIVRTNCRRHSPRLNFWL